MPGARRSASRYPRRRRTVLPEREARGRRGAPGRGRGASARKRAAARMSARMSKQRSGAARRLGTPTVMRSEQSSEQSRGRGQRAACGAGRCHTCDAARGSPRRPPRPSSVRSARPSPLTAEPAKCTTFPTSSDHKLKGGMPHFLPPNRKAESQVCRHPAAREQKVTSATPWSLFWPSAFRCLRARLVKMPSSEWAAD